MEPAFPIYFADDVGWMVECIDADAAATRIEPNDLDGVGIRCWDSLGRRVALAVERSHVVVLGAAQTDELDELKRAMGACAKLAVVKADARIDALVASTLAPQELWLAIVALTGRNLR